MNTKLASALLAGTMFTAGVGTTLVATTYNGLGEETLQALEDKVTDFSDAADTYIDLAEQLQTLATEQNEEGGSIDLLVEKIDELRGYKEQLESSRDGLIVKLNGKIDANSSLSKEKEDLEAELKEANKSIEQANSEIYALRTVITENLNGVFIDLEVPDTADLEESLADDSISEAPGIKGEEATPAK